MKAVIEPGMLGGSIASVASKSVAHRVLILAATGDKTCDINCNASSDDIDATASCLRSLGAQITKTRLGFRVVPIREVPATAELDCRESGSTLRFLLPLTCALGCKASFYGHGRLAKRPLSPLYEQLIEHGCTLSPQGSFPLSAEGPLRAGNFRIPGNVSSQFISGLLMSAPKLDTQTTIVVDEPLQSRSYVNMTLRALASFAIAVREGRERIEGAACTVYAVPAGAHVCSPDHISIEGDWSNAAFWLAGGALSEKGVMVDGLSLSSTQGDRTILAALASLGARVQRSGSSASCERDRLVGRTIDVTDIPDLVPPLAAVAAFCEGTTRFTGAERLRLKESDRLQTIAAAITALGGSAQIGPDTLTINGRSHLSGGTVDAAGDHRIAMMSAVAACFADGPTIIRGAECVSKSYPRFFDDLKCLGGHVALENEE